jgi:hypothetical protein
MMAHQHTVDVTKLGKPEAEVYYSKVNGDLVCVIVATSKKAAEIAQKGVTAPILLTLVQKPIEFWLGKDLYYEP